MILNSGSFGYGFFCYFRSSIALAIGVLAFDFRSCFLFPQLRSLESGRTTIRIVVIIDVDIVVVYNLNYLR